MRSRLFLTSLATFLFTGSSIATLIILFVSEDISYSRRYLETPWIEGVFTEQLRSEEELKELEAAREAREKAARELNIKYFEDLSVYEPHVDCPGISRDAGMPDSLSVSCINWLNSGLGSMVAGVLPADGMHGLSDVDSGSYWKYRRGPIIDDWGDELVLYVTDVEHYENLKSGGDFPERVFVPPGRTGREFVELSPEENGRDSVLISNDTGPRGRFTELVSAKVSRIEYARYSLSDMLKWRELLVESSWRVIKGASFVDFHPWDPRGMFIEVGYLEESSSVEELLSLLDKLGIPSEAVRILEEPICPTDKHSLTVSTLDCEIWHEVPTYGGHYLDEESWLLPKGAPVEEMHFRFYITEESEDPQADAERAWDAKIQWFLNEDGRDGLMVARIFGADEVLDLYNARVSPAPDNYRDIAEVGKRDPENQSKDDGRVNLAQYEYHFYDESSRRADKNAKWNVYTPPELIRWSYMIARSDLWYFVTSFAARDTNTHRLDFDLSCGFSQEDAANFLEGMGIPSDVALFFIEHNYAEYEDKELGDSSGTRSSEYADDFCPHPDYVTVSDSAK